VVRAGDGATVAEIVRKAGEPERALIEGRVFVGRRRVTSGALPVKPGDEVIIGPSPTASAAASGAAGFRVLWQEAGLLACVKPAGMPTVPDHAGSAHTLVALAAASLGRTVNELFVTSRLDREVSGVVVFATSLAAEARLKEARAQGRYERRYVAIARDGATSSAPWEAPIGAGQDARHRAAFGPDAKESRTIWSAVARAGGFALLAVAPQTGRTHQIRVHASHAGAPLLGDRDYGGPTRVTLPDGRVVSLARIALHAARVTVPDEAGAPRAASAPIPPELIRAWTDLGGASEAWDTAVTCALGT
jgi:23S rRNA pseudouridine955/2504/2580 synthase/23S rRNA pseudouridine1911/1915/1917 synthase